MLRASSLHALQLKIIFLAVTRLRPAGAKDDDHHVTHSRP